MFSDIHIIYENESVNCSVVSNLCDPMDCSLPGFSVHWLLQARILEWVAIPYASPSDLLTQEPNLGLLHCRQILYCLSHIIDIYDLSPVDPNVSLIPTF